MQNEIRRIEMIIEKICSRRIKSRRDDIHISPFQGSDYRERSDCYNHSTPSELLIKNTAENNDPWSNPDAELPSVDTGIPDFSINHDHYLYGTPKNDPIHPTTP